MCVGEGVCKGRDVSVCWRVGVVVFFNPIVSLKIKGVAF